MLIVIFLLVALLTISTISQTKGIIITTVCYATLNCFTIYNLKVTTIVAIYLLFFLYIKKRNVIFSRKSSNNVNRFPFTIVFLFALASYSISYVLNPIGANQGPTLFLNCFAPYILPFLLWYYYEGNKNINVFYIRCLVLYIIICMLVGFIEISLGEHIFTNFRDSIGINVEDLGFENERTGIISPTSLTVWPEAYGTILSFTICSILILMLRGKININMFHIILVFFLFLSVVSTGSRSLFVTACIMSLGLSGYIMKNRKFLFISLLALPFALYVGYELISNLVNSIIYHDEAGGSSADMRIEQLETTIILTANNALFGNGLLSVSYFIELYKSLRGAESIIFTSLLTRGIVGLISVFLIWIAAIIYSIKTDKLFLIPLIVGFMFDKIATLTYGLEETIFLFYMIPMLKSERYLNSPHLK